MSTEDITLDHVLKMVRDSKVVGGCDSKCTHTAEQTNQPDGTKFFTITHYASNRKDSHTIPAASMSLMEESTIANFFYALHETLKSEDKANKELAAEVRKVRAAQKPNG